MHRQCIGGPLHGCVVAMGHFPEGYDFEPGEDGVWRFVHKEET